MPTTHTDRSEYKALPNLRTACSRIKRMIVRSWIARARAATTIAESMECLARVAELRKTSPAAYRYEALMVEAEEVRSCPLYYLQQHLGLHPATDPMTVGRWFVRL